MSVSRILIIGPSWVGDMVMAQSLFHALKVDNQQCLIDVVAPHWALPLIERMPEVNRGFELPIKHGEFALIKRYQIGRRLREYGYGRAITLPNSWKSALIPFFAGIPLRIGYLGECRWGLLNQVRRLDNTQLKLTVQRFVALANNSSVTEKLEIAAPELIADKNQAGELLQRFKLSVSDQPVLALCPGAEYGSSKQWPEQHYIRVAQHYIAKGWQIWLLGSKNDRVVCSTIKQQVDVECIDFSGKTTLSEAIDLLSLTTAVVTNDSGLMHIAAALNKPLVALYGSSDPTATPALGKRVSIVTLGLHCSPCFERECPYQHRHCLTQINPGLVIDRLNALCEL
ncbi:MAG: lipopolysaccharide heptosyltransferase II [Methylococcales bacterium]